MPSTQQEPVRGHKKMILWQMIDKLDFFVQKEILTTYAEFEDLAIKTKYLFDRTIYSLERKRAEK